MQAVAQNRGGSTARGALHLASLRMTPSTALHRQHVHRIPMILPTWIRGLNQCQLLRPAPSLQLLLSGQRGSHIGGLLVEHQPANAVLPTKPGDNASPMRIDPTNQVVGDS